MTVGPICRPDLRGRTTPFFETEIDARTAGISRYRRVTDADISLVDAAREHPRGTAGRRTGRRPTPSPDDDVPAGGDRIPLAHPRVRAAVLPPARLLHPVRAARRGRRDLHAARHPPRRRRARSRTAWYRGRPRCCRSRLLALALGVVEASLRFTRRWVQGTATLGMERDIRDVLYRHLQSLPPAFHDRWLSGQLLSRATRDLSAVRRFFGFGLIFLVVNIATFVAICTLLRAHRPVARARRHRLAAADRIPAAPRFHRQASPAVSRLVQDQSGDLATTVEEAATGDPGRSRRSAAAGTSSTQHTARQPRGPRHPAGQGPAQGRLRSRSSTSSPTRRSASSWCSARWRSGSGRITLGEPGRVHHARAAARLAGRVARLHPRLRAGGGDGGPARLRGARHRRPTSRRPGGTAVRARRAGRRPAGRGGCGSRASRYRFPGSDRDVLPTSTSSSSPARPSRSSARAGRARRRSRCSLPRLADVTAAG